VTPPARSAAAAVFVAALVNVSCFQPAGSDGGIGDARDATQAERGDDTRAGDARDAQTERPTCDPARFSYAATPIVEDGGATCQFVPPPPPPPASPDRFLVRADDATTVPQDRTHTDGWDYTDETMIRFELFGAPCAAFLAGDIRTLCVEFQFF
jgi:hypothetical protein